ncbi:hypothetical protein CAP35_07625 [Chitinophagaceae bacterium IBVUCB1]|nr:hypothetical protein CAP35_07625 [Chitinophagaceae bacterium IBVUCB1]
MTRLINIVYLLLGSMIGYNASTFLNGTGAVPVSTNKMESPDKLQKETISIQQGLQERIDAVNTENAALKIQVSKSGSALSKAKRTNAQLEEKVNELIAYGNELSDTAQMLENCDTLEQTIQVLMANNTQKDSLYDRVITGMEKQLINKDTTLLMQQEQIQSLQLSFDESISQQTLLLEENKQYKKTFRRQKIKNGLLSAGGLVLSGIIAYGLLR